MSAKSQKRRLARKYPKKLKANNYLDWSSGAADPIADLHAAIEQSYAPVESFWVQEGSEAHRIFHPESYYDRSKIRKENE